jgi:hypothetical protein
MKEQCVFKEGCRYRNRIGWYEVLEILDEDKMRVRYEHNNQELVMSELKILKRIWDNIQNEDTRSKPYDNNDLNSLFFKTLGYLVNHSFIEAIIPLKSKDGFDINYFRIKKKKPTSNMQGYYVHNDSNVDKWGTEMRITFEKTTISLDLGGDYTIVKSPDPNKLRINSNQLCFDLLSRGFNLGDKQVLYEIESKIPAEHLKDFQTGLNL